MDVYADELVSYLPASRTKVKAKQVNNVQHGINGTALPTKASHSSMKGESEDNHESRLTELIAIAEASYKQSLIAKLSVVQPFPFMRLLPELRTTVYKEILVQVC